MGLELLEEADEKLRDVSSSSDLRYVGLTEAIRRMDEVTTRNYFTRIGYNEGLAEGRTEGLAEGILTLLTARFGPLPFQVEAALNKQKSPERLRALMFQTIAAHSLSELWGELDSY